MQLFTFFVCDLYICFGIYGGFFLYNSVSREIFSERGAFMCRFLFGESTRERDHI